MARVRDLRRSHSLRVEEPAFEPGKEPGLCRCEVEGSWISGRAVPFGERRPGIRWKVPVRKAWLRVEARWGVQHPAWSCKSLALGLDPQTCLNAP